MEKQVILLDTSILIDYYRKKDKTKSYLYKLLQNYQSFAVSTITHYEIYIGADISQTGFWDSFFLNLSILPFDNKASQKAVSIYKQLKIANKLIDLPDLFIAATAITHKLPCATLNKKHFQRIAELELLNY